MSQFWHRPPNWSASTIPNQDSDCFQYQKVYLCQNLYLCQLCNCVCRGRSTAVVSLWRVKSRRY